MKVKLNNKINVYPSDLRTGYLYEVINGCSNIGEIIIKTDTKKIVSLSTGVEWGDSLCGYIFRELQQGETIEIN